MVGNGSIPARGLNQSLLGYLQHRRHVREAACAEDGDHISLQQTVSRRKFVFPNPLLTLKILGDKESCIVLLYNGLFFTGMMVTTASIPDLYQAAYGLDTLDIGLCFITMGFGSLTSALTMGHLVDWNFRRHAQRLGVTITKGKQQDLSAFPIERVRFEVVLPGHIIGTLAFIAFGWTLKFRTSLAGPEIALYFIGFGVSTAFNITNTLLIDLHRDSPATATAAVNLVRCLMSAGGAAAILPMCHAMNTGWAFTFIALLFVALIPVIFLIMNKGQDWRNEAARRKAEKQRAQSSDAHAQAEGIDVERQDNDFIDDAASSKEKEKDVEQTT